MRMIINLRKIFEYSPCSMLSDDPPLQLSNDLPLHRSITVTASAVGMTILSVGADIRPDGRGFYFLPVSDWRYLKFQILVALTQSTT
jgi:hypothetical protein